MVNEIRLCKGMEIGRKAYAFGVANSNWFPGWFRVEFSERAPFVSIKDGLIAGVPVYYAKGSKQGQAVPATEILEAVLAEPGNVRTFGQNSKGYTNKTHFGITRKWYVDYAPELVDTLKKYGLEFETNKTFVNELKDLALGDLRASGLIPNDDMTSSPGQQALEAAKDKARVEEINALKAQLEASLKQNEELAKMAEGEGTPKVKKEKKEKELVNN
jgi:hypothetical protein|tara:strand:+ start:11816 stop:12463 length:648 start_codon:yes stop_codon:yes gene_type:complete